MDGVTILQTIPQYTNTWGWSWDLLAFLIPLILIVLLIWCGVDCGEGSLIMIGIIVAFITVVGFVVTLSTNNAIHTHDHYQVLIDESVSMTEFTEKYNVIEQQGITYIVEEKVVE